MSDEKTFDAEQLTEVELAGVAGGTTEEDESIFIRCNDGYCGYYNSTAEIPGIRYVRCNTCHKAMHFSPKCFLPARAAVKPYCERCKKQWPGKEFDLWTGTEEALIAQANGLG